MNLSAKPYRLTAAIIAIVLAAAAAIWVVNARGASPEDEADAAVRAAGFDADERAAIEALVRNYLLENPEILPEVVERLREKQAEEAMAGIQQDLFTPYPGAYLGNPKGTKVLVEFSDYACGFCRKSVEAVEELIAEDPDLKVVIREFPILSQGSVDAAKMALAAAHQGKYEEFHRAMYEIGKPTPENIEKAARQAGLDLAMAQKAAASNAVAAEIEANRAFANQLQFDGTPAWVTQDQMLQGAVGKAALSSALSGKGG